ncbi:MAG: hypothetical protein AAGH15_21680, partial [Myxococcota bacterium]
ATLTAAAPVGAQPEAMAVELRVEACGAAWAEPERLGPALLLELASAGRPARLAPSGTLVRVRAQDCAAPAELELLAREGDRSRAATTSLDDVLPESRPRVLAIVLAELLAALAVAPDPEAPAAEDSETAPRPLATPRVLDVRLAGRSLRRDPDGSGLGRAPRGGVEARLVAELDASFAAAADEGAWSGAGAGFGLRLPRDVSLGADFRAATAVGRADVAGMAGRVRGVLLGLALDAAWLPETGRWGGGPVVRVSLLRLRTDGELARSLRSRRRSAVVDAFLGAALKLRLVRRLSLRGDVGLIVPIMGYEALAQGGRRVLGYAGGLVAARFALVVRLGGAPRPGAPTARLGAWPAVTAPSAASVTPGPR